MRFRCGSRTEYTSAHYQNNWRKLYSVHHCLAGSRYWGAIYNYSWCGEIACNPILTCVRSKPSRNQTSSVWDLLELILERFFWEEQSDRGKISKICCQKLQIGQREILDIERIRCSFANSYHAHYKCFRYTYVQSDPDFNCNELLSLWENYLKCDITPRMKNHYQLHNKEPIICFPEYSIQLSLVRRLVQSTLAI